MTPAQLETLRIRLQEEMRKRGLDKPPAPKFSRLCKHCGGPAGDDLRYPSCKPCRVALRPEVREHKAKYLAKRKQKEGRAA